MYGIQCAENQHAHFSSALGLFGEKEAIYISISSYTYCWIYIVLELIPFMPRCSKHLKESEEKKGFIWLTVSENCPS